MESRDWAFCSNRLEKDGIPETNDIDKIFSSVKSTPNPQDAHKQPNSAIQSRGTEVVTAESRPDRDVLKGELHEL